MKFAVITEPISGPVDEVIGDFDSEELAGQYLEQNGWHKSIGRWWAKVSSQSETNRAMIHPMKSPQPPPKPRRRKLK